MAVLERTGRYRGQDLDRAAAEMRVARLERSPAVRPMGEVLRDATDWVRELQGYRGEIYVFTDLAAIEWSEDMLADLAAQLDELADANVYLIDVGIERPPHLGLGAGRLSGQQPAPGDLPQIP